MSAAIVIDASVALKWILDEEHSDLARALAGRALVAPDLLLSECANGLWRWVRLGALPARTAQQRFAVLRRAPVELSRIEALLEPGLDLAIRMDHPIYDCLYLALALSRRTKLVSADRRFVSAVRRHPGLAASVVLLSETAH